MKKLICSVLVLSVSILAMAAGNQAAPQSGAAAEVGYPSKQITMIVPDPPGGSSDLVSRLAFAKVEKILGQTVVIVNKGSSGSLLGILDLTKSAPDGYTISNMSDFDIASSFAAGVDLGFTVDQLEFVCSLTKGTLALFLGPSFPGERSVAGLVAYAKANPGKVTFGHATAGQATVLKSLEKEAGIKITPVVFSGGNDSYTALIGGHIDAAILGTRFHEQAKARGCTTIAVTSHEPFSLLPDVPTLLASGYNVVNMEVCRAFFMPAGTPKPTVDKMAAAMQQATDNDEFRKAMEAQNEVYLFRNGDDALKAFKEKIEQLKPFVTN